MEPECLLEKRLEAKTKLGQTSSFRFLPEKEKQVRIISFSVRLHTNARTHLTGSEKPALLKGES